MRDQIINVDIMRDYYSEVRRNLKAAADKKAAERQAEARKQRWAKIIVIALLLLSFAAIAICSNYLPA